MRESERADGYADETCLEWSDAGRSRTTNRPGMGSRVADHVFDHNGRRGRHRKHYQEQKGREGWARAFVIMAARTGRTAEVLYNSGVAPEG